MSRIMNSLSVSSGSMKSFEVEPDNSIVTKTVESKAECVVVNFEERSTPPVNVPAEYQTIGDFIKDLSADEASAAQLEKSRKWVADEFYDNDTIRTRRLRNGWSQAVLAEKLGTSQSHVARIERGKENLHISTCRKLCTVLAIDMNTLNSMLEHQEALLAETQK